MANDIAPLPSGARAKYVQWACFALGALMCATYSAGQVAGELGRRVDVEAFEVAQPDFTHWSRTRIEQFHSSSVLSIAAPIAVLRARSLELEVPLYAQTSEIHLNRGVALIDGMSAPDQGGNVGVAGHRDGYFRVLRGIQGGEVIEVQTHARLHRYRVVSISIVDAADNSLLEDTAEPTLTLVTCYPFHHIGRAPQRFVVRGEYLWD